MIYLGADHRGFELKEAVKNWAIENEYEQEDLGDYVFNPEDDYIDYGLKVAEQIEGSDGKSIGLLFCGSGHGMEIVANRFPHVRAILGFNNDVVQQGREHEDANILVIPADWTSVEQAIERVVIFLNTQINLDTRHARRRQRMNNIQISNKA